MHTWAYLMKIIPEKRVVHTWAHLMKIIPEARRAR
jgi:hypothetical protein